MNNITDRENADGNPSQTELMDLLYDTSRVASLSNVEMMMPAIKAAELSNPLVSDVEFIKWMQRNYHNSGIFDSVSSMQDYLALGEKKTQWFRTTIQGKSYEWEYTNLKERNIFNITKRYDLGDNPTRTGTDLTEVNLLTGSRKEFQMKAYTSKNKLDLHNTPKSATVVTNDERIINAQEQGYSAESFQDSQTIIDSVDQKIDQIQNGTIRTNYRLSDVSSIAARAGLAGLAIGVTSETITRFEDWANGRINGKEYLLEITKAGASAASTSIGASVITVFVAAKIKSLGLSEYITFPVAFVLGKSIDQVIEPCFARGRYQNELSIVRYYNAMTPAYLDFLDSVQKADLSYQNMVRRLSEESLRSKKLDKDQYSLEKSLRELYDKI